MKLVAMYELVFGIQKLIKRHFTLYAHGRWGSQSKPYFGLLFFVGVPVLDTTYYRTKLKFQTKYISYD